MIRSQNFITSTKLKTDDLTQSIPFKSSLKGNSFHLVKFEKHLQMPVKKIRAKNSLMQSKSI